MKRYLLLFLIIPAFLSSRGVDKENYPKGQINKVEQKFRSLDAQLHTDIPIYQTNISESTSGWKKSVDWTLVKDGETGSEYMGVGSAGSYRTNLNCRLISPLIQLPEINTRQEKIAFSFDESFSLESSFDKGFVEISTDGGRNWLKIDSRSGTNGMEWKNTCLFLDNYSGKAIQLAFRFTSDESFSGQGWFVKNPKIVKSTYHLPSVIKQFSDTKILKSASAGISGTMNSLNSQNFPYIYMNILLSENDAGVSNLVKNDFSVFEDGTQVSDYNVTPPAAASGAKLVDIVFLVDNSGSFDDEQNAVRNNMESFVNQLAASGNDFALGLCRFGQSSGYGYPILEDNGQLTSNIEYFKNTVWLRNVTNGSTEVGYHAIVKASQGFNFRPGAQKIFIILTDETPNQGGSTKQEATDACLNNYISLFAMTNNESAALNDIAAATNGRSYDITDPFNDILNDISASVNNNYMISYKSPNPAFNGVERQVRVHATSKTGTSTDVTGSYVPGAAPQIERTAETINYGTKGWDKGTSFLISVTITDSKEPFTTGVTLYYRHSTDASYTSVSMTNTSGSIWSATIPGTAADNPGVDYYISATDGNVTSSLPKVEPNVNPFQIGILPNEKPVITHTVPATNYSPGQAITFNATVTDNTNWVSKVKLYYRSPGELLYSMLEMTNSSGNNYSCQLTTSLSATGLEYYIVAEDDLGLKSYWASADVPQLINSGQLPNLKPHAVEQNNWTSPLIIAVTTDASSDATLIYNNQEIIISFAYINDGNTSAGAHSVELLIDGVVSQTWTLSSTTESGFFNYLFNHNIGTLAAGSHTIAFRFDTKNEVTESDETDNEYSKTITVLAPGSSVANLAPYTPENWSSPVVLTTIQGTTTKATSFHDDQDVFLNLAYVNLGDADAGSHISFIYIDETADTLYWTNNNGLQTMTYLSTIDYNMGKLSAGQHVVRFVIDGNNEVRETDETDNEYSDTITVSPRYQPNLLPYKPNDWDASIVVSKVSGTHTNQSGFTTSDNIYIDAAFENNGGIASGAYYARIYIDSLLYSFEDPEGIDLVTFKYINDFNAGKLNRGTHEIKLLVDCFNDVAESDETDNIKTITIEVDYPTEASLNKTVGGIKVWPNPSASYFNIDFGKPLDTNLRIFDLAGRLVYQSKIENEQTKKILTENMPNGSYLLRVVDNDEVINRKIIIQK